MKFVSWNVNGIRACLTKGFEDRFRELDADIFCLQETKCQQGQVKIELPGYHQYWNYANRKGYSGTAIFTKQEPLSVFYGIGIEEHVFVFVFCNSAGRGTVCHCICEFSSEFLFLTDRFFISC